VAKYIDVYANCFSADRTLSSVCMRDRSKLWFNLVVPGYYPVRLAKSYKLDALPSVDDFVSDNS